MIDQIAYIRLNRPEKLEAAAALARQVIAHPRAVLAEWLQHASIVAGKLKWNMTDGFKDAVRAKAGR